MNYRQANELLTGRCKESRKLANNTYLMRQNDDIVVRLHETNIITFKPDGKVVLSSGGWLTPTTKNRLNDYAGVNVYQDKGQWYIGSWDQKDNPLFHDGVTIKNGKVLRPRFKDKKSERLQRQIKAYCKKLKELDVLPVPGSGDCWYCLMKTDDGVTLGDATNYIDHLKSHLKEKYIHGSLIFNALREAGHSDVLISMIFDTHERNLNYRNYAVRAVSRYFKKRLAIAC